MMMTDEQVELLPGHQLVEQAEYDVAWRSLMNKVRGRSLRLEKSIVGVPANEFAFRMYEEALVRAKVEEEVETALDLQDETVMLRQSQSVRDQEMSLLKSRKNRSALSEIAKDKEIVTILEANGVSLTQGEDDQGRKSGPSSMEEYLRSAQLARFRSLRLGKKSKKYQ